MFDLAKGAVATLVQVGLAAGGTDPNSAAVDMAGYRGCLFVGIVGSQGATSASQIQVEHSDDNQSWSTLTGAAAATAADADDKLLLVDVQHSSKRYLRTKLTRNGADIVWGGTVAIRYGPRGTPVETDATHAVAPVQVVGV